MENISAAKALHQIIKIKFPEKYKKYCLNKNENWVWIYVTHQYSLEYKFCCIICDQTLPISHALIAEHGKNHLQEYNILAFI